MNHANFFLIADCHNAVDYDQYYKVLQATTIDALTSIKMCCRFLFSVLLLGRSGLSVRRVRLPGKAERLPVSCHFILRQGMHSEGRRYRLDPASSPMRCVALSLFLKKISISFSFSFSNRWFTILRADWGKQRTTFQLLPQISFSLLLAVSVDRNQ